ncbi:vasodilator-stimulated phosphoprotein, partial [Heterostelium album PN500]
EVHILVGRAQVFTYSAGTNNWVPSSQHPATLLLYHHQTNNTYRIIARGFEDPNVILINFSITKEVTYKLASANFHTFSDQRTHYGINFSTKEEADQFGSGFENVLKQLKSGQSPPQPPPPSYPASQPVQQQQPPQMQLPPQINKPAASAPPQMPVPVRPQSTILNKPPAPPAGPPAPPAAPPAPKPPAPPAAPPPPAVSGGGGGGGRSGLLSSIEGFSKNGLKKTVTVDKSSPLIGNNNASTPAPAPSSGGAAGGGGAPKAMMPMGGGGGNIMAEAMAKRAAMKKTAAPKEDHTPPAPAPVKEQPPPPVKEPKPAPVTASKPKPPPTMGRPSLSPSASPSSTASTPSALSDDMLTLKEEILAEFRRELQKFKEEILDAIRNR